MTDRIASLARKTVNGEMWVNPVETPFDREDLFLSQIQMDAKRACDYILHQEPLIVEENRFAGYLSFNLRTNDRSKLPVGDIFGRRGHRNLAAVGDVSYNRPWYNLVTFEWQHSVGDFGKLMRTGLAGVRREIERSMEVHTNELEKLEFLRTQLLFCDTVVKYAHKCASRALEVAEETQVPAYKQNLQQLSQALQRIPEHPAETFYEAVLTIYALYAYLPDSIGLIDRYLYDYYKRDTEAGILTDGEAKEYLQELFCMLQAKTDPNERAFHRGGEAHFSIGGYLENGEDGFNALSRLIVEALLELPTWAPQISLRWNPRTPREVLRYMLDCERRDPNKRIAFVNDEPRIQAFMEYQGMAFAEAVQYTTTGCNEIALPGGMLWGTDVANLVRSVEHTFYRRTEDICRAADFDAFYAIYEEELIRDLDEIDRISCGMQMVRNRDVNIVSNFLLEGCIANAVSCTQKGGVSRYIPIIALIGLTTVFDCLSVTKQIVYDEKWVTMEELTAALRENWRGYEVLHNRIRKMGCFFGNGEERADAVARRLLSSIRAWNKGENYFEKKWLFGNLVGYNDHHRIFGDNTRATPDGRLDGDMISYGLSQGSGRDREGLTALLSSIARVDPQHVLTGASVTNVLLEESLVRNEDSFERLVDLFETYFRMGGLHFQLNYVSREELLAAKEQPENYASVRVRVSGFSEYFVNLIPGLQDEIVLRTPKSR